MRSYEMAFTPPDDQFAYKRLVVAGNDDIFYEDLDAVADGEMKDLEIGAGQIDTSDQLNMFEAYQKVFIVNGAKFKVADFVNTKLSTLDIRPDDDLNIAPLKGTILTGTTSEAKMVVDYCNAINGTALIYGYVISGTFDEAAELVTGTNASGTPTAVSFTLNALPVAKPHWYDWTPYNDDENTYGSMPNKAYLGCLYCGRGIISGNPEHPDQWYMTRQTDLWDFAYLAGDAGTPVKGGAADAGELGDIVRCLIPYKDDYLIFGCATSIWYLSGDPAYGGELFGLDLTTGIFGANSWCWDGAGNLYFWGTNGFYRTTIPGVPECLSAIALPDIIKDRVADPSTHRITMIYNRIDYGIHICITLLEDGSNYNYWYDLKTEGFFLETYPIQCGAYSLFYYAANDTTLRDVIVGCKDGYLRKFDKTAKDDNIGESDQLIDSYAVLGPLQLSTGIGDGILGNINIVSAGGILGGEDDSDDIDFSVFAARTSEHITKDITAKYSGVFNSPGYQKGNKDRRKARGKFGAVKIGNDTETETWGFEKLTLDVKQIGRVL